MVLVAAEPLGVLPAWMYHAQAPPPTHETNAQIAGLTWPDLVFPFFMFALGTAIPLSLSRRLDRGARYSAIVGGAVARGVLLIFFALFRQHFDSTLSGLPGATGWFVALAAFAVLFLTFARFPATWSRAVRTGIRLAGWAAAIGMFALVEFPDGSRFQPERIDIILLLLAYCATFGTLVWLVTRQSVRARLAILAIIASLRIVRDSAGWVNVVYAFDPIPWLYNFSFFQFLCAVIPGTIAGDLLLKWMRAHEFVAFGAADRQGWHTVRTTALAGLLLFAIPLVLAGVQGRYIFATTVAISTLSVMAILLSRHPSGPTESLIEQLVRWGSFWLVLGLLLDPFDGGTKKVPETFAWFFQGCGLAIFVLVAFLVVIDVLRRPRALQLLVDAGHNPMIAYVGLGMFVVPLLGLTTVLDDIQSYPLSPWLAFARSLVLVLIVALVVRFCTRRRLFWRT